MIVRHVGVLELKKVKLFIGFVFPKGIARVFPLNKFFSFQMISELRLYLPKKPTLTESCLGDKDYCELSTKFKAAHIKIMVFWTAKKTQEAADAAPQVSRIIWFQDFDFIFYKFWRIAWTFQKVDTSSFLKIPTSARLFHQPYPRFFFMGIQGTATPPEARQY